MISEIVIVLPSEVENLTMLRYLSVICAALITNVGDGPLLNDRGGAGAVRRRPLRARIISLSAHRMGQSAA